MAVTVSPEAERFVAAERAAGRYAAPERARAVGEVLPPLRLEQGAALELLRAAARRASGLFRPTTHTHVVWSEGGRELAVDLRGPEIVFGDGQVLLRLPVFCEQTGEAMVQVLFAVGSVKQPAGLFASTPQQPTGPEAIVEPWGESLVAFAWECLLGVVTDLSAAVGKDPRGNRLVPVELASTPRVLMVWPMARHRFGGGTGLGVAAPAVDR